MDVLNVKGGEVCVPPLTFVSTVAAVVYNGATPVYVDIDPETLCLDPEDFKRKITPKTKAVIPVHYGGHPCEMEEIQSLADRHGIAVVEDCAHAVGARFRGRSVGAFGVMGCFSFQAVKPLACGDGGMITTQDPNHDRILRSLRWLGADKDTYQRDQKGYDWYYEITRLGYKGYMNDITAAIGLAQLEKLDAMNARRGEIVGRYHEAFRSLGWFQTPVERAHVKHAHHNYAIKIDTERVNRAKFMEELKQKGISTGVHYLPVYKHPYYKTTDPKTPVTEAVWEKIVLLPLFSSMTDEEIQTVIDAVKSYQGIKALAV
jgi:perosamine synthetase